jgi:hypothetical protein
MRSRGLAWALAGAIVLVYGVAFACSTPETVGLTSGFLGAESWESELVVPRNLAVLEIEGVELLDERDEVIALMPVVDALWSRPSEPLEVGSVIRIGHQEAEVSEAIDETPPTAPGLASARVRVFDVDPAGAGCTISASPCDGTQTLYLDFVPASDDFSAPERITYAVYAGTTAAEAAEASLPLRLLLAPHAEDASLMDGWGVHDTEGVEWLSLAAVDQAGNVSARTSPVRIAR